MGYLTKEVIGPTLKINHSHIPQVCLLLRGEGEHCIWNVAGDQECQLHTPIFNTTQVEGVFWDIYYPSKVKCHFCQLLYQYLIPLSVHLHYHFLTFLSSMSKSILERTLLNSIVTVFLKVGKILLMCFFDFLAICAECPNNTTKK